MYRRLKAPSKHCREVQLGFIGFYKSNVQVINVKCVLVVYPWYKLSLHSDLMRAKMLKPHVNKYRNENVFLCSPTGVSMSLDSWGI